VIVYFPPEERGEGGSDVAIALSLFWGERVVNVFFHFFEEKREGGEERFSFPSSL